MKITSDKEEMIFRKDFNDRPSYSLGLSKKDEKGNFISGYINVTFRKDVELENKTKIKIKDAWLSFYEKDKKTYPYIFINEFDVVEQEEKENIKEVEKEDVYKDFGDNLSEQITTNDLPF